MRWRYQIWWLVLIVFALGTSISCSSSTSPASTITRYLGQYDLITVAGQPLPIRDTTTGVTPLPAGDEQWLVGAVLSISADSAEFAVTEDIRHSDGSSDRSTGFYHTPVDTANGVALLIYNRETPLPVDTLRLFFDSTARQTILVDSAASRTSPIQLGPLRFVKRTR
jgi:hypothetical protein